MTLRAVLIAAQAVAVAFATATADAHAGDAKAGRAKAASACAVCHGQDGIASMPTAPNLAGQHAGYLAEQMRLYRNGKRAHEIMTVVAKGLTEGEIDEIVAWCSSIKVEVKVPD